MRRWRPSTTTDNYGHFAGEEPTRFWLRMDGDGRPAHQKFQSEDRNFGLVVVETFYRDWREFEAI